MSSELIGIVFFFGFFILLIGGIFLIAYIAAQSRKKKQKALLKNLPNDSSFHAFVRYNRGNAQDQILKIKAFQGSGLIYVSGSNLNFKTTTGFQHVFDLKESKIFWEGENLINGLLKWFSVTDTQEKIFLNVETGMFIFHTGGGSKPTTKSIYDYLIAYQSKL